MSIKAGQLIICFHIRLLAFSELAYRLEVYKYADMSILSSNTGDSDIQIMQRLICTPTK